MPAYRKEAFITNLRTTSVDLIKFRIAMSHKHFFVKLFISAKIREIISQVETKPAVSLTILANLHPPARGLCLGTRNKTGSFSIGRQSIHTTAFGFAFGPSPNNSHLQRVLWLLLTPWHCHGSGASLNPMPRTLGPHDSYRLPIRLQHPVPCSH